MDVYAPDGTRLDTRIVMRHEIKALLDDGWAWLDTWPGSPAFYLMVRRP